MARMTKGQRFVLALNAYIRARLEFEKNPGGGQEEFEISQAEESLADMVDEILGS